MFLKKIKPVIALGALLALQPVCAANLGLDAAAIEIGTGAKVQMVRVSVQDNWKRTWFESNGTHLSGYSEYNLAQWRGNAYRNVPGDHQNITVIGTTPVFRFERTDKRGLYGEIGVGMALFSQLYNNDDNRLSTAFQFADHLGVGYVFDNKWELAAKLQHYSNGAIKKPNSGVNWFVVKLGRHF